MDRYLGRSPALARPQVVRRAVLRILAVVVVLWGVMTALSSSTYSTTVLFTDVGGVGIPPPSRNLDFGDVAAGLELHRTVMLENDGKVDTFVVVFSWGGIRDFLSIDDAFFNLSPGEQHNIDFSVVAPANASPDRHSGRVFVVRIPWWSPF